MDWVFWVLFFFSLWRLWVHLAICSKIKNWVVGLIFRDLGHREVDVGGEIVSYNFRSSSLSARICNLPPHFLKSFGDPLHLPIWPSIHPSMLLGSRLHTPPWIQVTLLVWWFSATLLYASLFVLSSDYFHSSLKCSCKLLTDTTCLLPSPWRQTQSRGLCWHLQHSRQVEIVYTGSCYSIRNWKGWIGVGAPRLGFSEC